MPLLYLWRWDNFQQDRKFGFGYHLNQASRGLHRIELGEPLWAFTRHPKGHYVLVAELIAKAKTINHPRLTTLYRYGSYRLWGDLSLSRYFMPDEQPPIDQVIRALSLGVKTDVIGRSFQGPGAVRVISSADSALLAQVAAQLQPDPRATLYPEDRFAALAVAGTADEVERLLAADSAVSAQERLAYHYGAERALVRRRTGELRERYQDSCQLCGWTGLTRYRRAVCEAHHLHWRSRGGPDTLENLVLLCPNHHRIVHRADAVFDYRDHAFVFDQGHREPLREVGHLAG